jgi:hypothetical protein
MGLERAQTESIGARRTVTSLGPQKGRIWRGGEVGEGVRMVATENDERIKGQGGIGQMGNLKKKQCKLLFRHTLRPGIWKQYVPPKRR